MTREDEYIHELNKLHADITKPNTEPLSAKKPFSKFAVTLCITLLLIVGVTAAYYILTEQTFTVDSSNPADFIVFNQTDHTAITSITGHGGDVYNFGFNLTNLANRNLNYTLISNCSNVNNGDVFLAIHLVDEWNSTTGIVNSDNIAIGSDNTKTGTMEIQFNQSYAGNSDCSWQVTAGDFSWK